MSQAQRRPMTIAEFLEWEEQQEGKYEFDGRGVVRAITGGSAAHARVSLNVATSLRIRLRGTPCEAFGSDLKIEVAGAVRYPDAFVVCTPVANKTLAVDRPVVVFEVLSPSTAIVDFTDKHDEYQDTPSIMRYVILRQDRMYATIFFREAGGWSREVLADGGVLKLPEIGIELPMTELYEDLVFDPA